MKSNLHVTAVALLALTLTGCISTESTEYRDPARLKVEFENDAAGRMFYETLSRTKNSTNHSESKTEVSIPIIFEHKSRVVEGDNAAFNDAVRRCDTNGDGKITELEAKIYLDQAAQKK